MKHLLLALPLLGLLVASAAPQSSPIAELRNAAADGDSMAIYLLASLYERGHDSIPADSAEAMRLYRLAAEKGLPRAAGYLGFLLYNNGDPDEGIRWISRAAALDDPVALSNLSWLLRYGDGVVHSDSLALYWARRAADTGLPSGSEQLADMYALGTSANAPDTAAATHYYIEAAMRGAPDAQFKLWNLRRNWFETMPLAEADSLGAQWFSGAMPWLGVQLLQRVAASDSSANFPRALRLMGDAYSLGRGTAYNHDASVTSYRRAALNGDSIAQRIVDELLEIFPDAF